MARTAQLKLKQALVLMGQCMTPTRIAYYTRVREAGAFGGRKAERGCLRNDRLGGQNG